MAQTMPTVWMIDPAGATRGTITYTEIAAVSRFNAVGTWIVKAPLTAQHALAAAPGWRVAIMDPGGTVMSGRVHEPTIEVGENNEGTGGGRSLPTITLSGFDENRVLEKRLAYPTPGNDVGAQTQAYDVRTHVCSTAMRLYVDVNAGPAAVVPRREPGLTLGPDLNIGGAVTGRARFETLLELLQGLAIQGGLGFRVVGDTGPGRVFEVYQPADRRGPARFSMTLNNLRYLKWSMRGPDATDVIGGGRGEEEARAFVTAGNAVERAGWGRTESFYDWRSASDDDGGAELTANTAKRLAEQGQTRQVDLIPVDTDLLRYGTDYGLGDQITVDVYGGVTLDAVIREVETRVSRSGRGPRRVVIPRVGDIGTSATPRQTAVVRDALVRLSALERR